MPEPSLTPPLSPAQRDAAAEYIGARSAEGRPANPSMGPRQMRWIVALGALVFVAVGVVIGLTMNWPAGIATMILGIGFYFLMPTPAAVLSRANERERILEHREEAPPE